MELTPLPEDRPEETGASLLRQRIGATAKTAGIAACISLAGTLCGVVAFFLKSGQQLPEIPKEGFTASETEMNAFGNLIMIGGSLIVSLIAFYYLFGFSRKARAAERQQHPGLLIGALQRLEGYFKLWAVLLIIFIAFMILSLISGILFSGAGA